MVKKNRYNYKMVFTALSISLVLIAILSVCCGAVMLPLSDLLEALLKRGGTANIGIVYAVRLPRLVATMLGGAGFAVAGVIIQTVLSNPLASPNIIGVNSGAGFFVVLSTVLFPNIYGLTPIFAFLGAIIAVMLVYGLSVKTSASKLTIVLAGVAISSLFSAGIDALTTFFPDSLIASNAFKIGGVKGVTFADLSPAWIMIVGAIIVTILLSKDMDVLSLGDDMAKSLGLNIKVIRFTLLTMAAIIAGSVVSFCGLIGFVGLMTPHLARKFVGNTSLPLILSSALIGSCFLTLCDIVARTAFSPFEVSVGIIVSFIGAPFFLYLIFKKKGGKHS